MKKVLAIGNALLDTLVQVEESFLATHSLTKGSMSLVSATDIRDLCEGVSHLPSEVSMGGSAGNCARALSRLGGEVGYVGKVGDDVAGRCYIESLNHYNIECRALHNPTEATGECLSLITPDGERTMNTFLGAALTLTAEDITAELFEGYDLLFVEGYLVQNPSLISRIFEVARAESKQIAIDLASYNVVEQSLDLLNTLLKERVSIIFANEAEAEAFTGEGDPMKAAEILSQRCDISVVKVGAKGSIIITEDEVIEVGATDHQRRDTTGAGDYFAGGFLRGYCAGESLIKSAQMGSIAGGAIIEVMGTTLSDEAWDITREQVQEVLR